MNTNIQEFKPLIKPNQLRDILPITPDIQNFVSQTRQQIQDIIHKKSKKKYSLLVLVQYIILNKHLNMLKN